MTVDIGAWIEGHAVIIGFLAAVAGWCWRIDGRLKVLATDVRWLKHRGCEHCPYGVVRSEECEEDD